MSVTQAELFIEGSRSPGLRQCLRELWMFRGTVLAFAERDCRLKYRQATLGVAWAVIQPLTFMTIFTVMLGRLARVPGGGVPYAAFSLSALVAWNYLQSAISFGANALVSDASLVRKVYFPREVPVLGAIVSAALDLAIGLGLFALVGPFLGARPSATWLLAPLLAVELAVLATAVALPLAAFNAYYRDFRHALPSALQLWLFASPVAYPLNVVPERWRSVYAVVNPAAGVLDGFRRILAMGELPDPELLALSVVSTLLVLVWSYRIFKRREQSFADVV